MILVRIWMSLFKMLLRSFCSISLVIKSGPEDDFVLRLGMGSVNSFGCISVLRTSGSES